MQTANTDPTAGETARRNNLYVEHAEQIGDPTDPRFHDAVRRDPRLRHESDRSPRSHKASCRGALTRPRITARPRPSDRPLGLTHDDLGAAFLPAGVRGDPPLGHVLGDSRETTRGDGTEAEERPVGHVRGCKPGQQPPGDLGRHPTGHVLGPARERPE
jgi:hypothetical protein